MLTNTQARVMDSFRSGYATYIQFWNTRYSRARTHADRLVEMGYLRCASTGEMEGWDPYPSAPPYALTDMGLAYIEDTE